MSRASLCAVYMYAIVTVFHASLPLFLSLFFFAHFFFNALRIKKISSIDKKKTKALMKRSKDERDREKERKNKIHMVKCGYDEILNKYFDNFKQI